MEPAGPVVGGRQSETSLEGLAELGLAACAAGQTCSSLHEWTFWGDEARGPTV